MEITYSELLGEPIVSRDIESKVARLDDLIVDPDRGLVVALKTNKKDLIIASHDIVHLKPAIEIHDVSSCISFEEIPAVKKILTQKIPLAGNLVKTQDGKFLGRVKDYTIDSLTLQLLKIYTAKSLLGIDFDRRVIPWSEIIMIKKEAIIVKDDSALVKYKVKNPFLPSEKLSPEQC